MYYIVTLQSPRHKQMSLEDLLFSPEDSVFQTVYYNTTANTRVFEVESISSELRNKTPISYLKSKLRDFNEKTAELRTVPREQLYYSFKIPKRTGGLRQIDAPIDSLKEALNELKDIFEQDFHAMYHTSAHAYIKQRGILTAIKRHQKNESKWFGKFDLHNFFGSTTPEFVTKMFSMIYPFCEVMKDAEGRELFNTAISLCFLHGGLPQGTPISPMITNIMMIPIDYKLFNSLHNEENTFVYTRYADDMLISSRWDFEINKVQERIKSVFSEFSAPFSLNEKKTRYGSSSGSNWNLGVMLNKDNQITVGWREKKHFQTMLRTYAMDKKNNKDWSYHDVKVLEGKLNYYKMVEGDTITRIVSYVSEKTGFNIVDGIKTDLRTVN